MSTSAGDDAITGAMRIVSLVPSVTETLLAWGVDPVAVTRFCEQPGCLTVGGTKTPDVAAIVGLRPHLVVMDREENRAEDAAALEAAGVALHVLHVQAVADVAPALAGLAAAVRWSPPAAGTPVAGTPVAGTRAAGTPVAGTPVGLKPAADPESSKPTLRAWIPIWRRPWMSINASTYGSSILAAAGVANVMAGAADRYPTVGLEEVKALQPDVVLAPSEPYKFADRHRAELEAVAPVIFVDGKDLFWWGVRTRQALPRLRAAVAGWTVAATPGRRSTGA